MGLDRVRLVLASLTFLVGCRHAPQRAGASQRSPLTAVRPNGLCVTAGALTPTAGRFKVRSAGMRAVTAGLASEEAELRFSYDGPSRETEPLGSGELRRQIGLKLRAQDTCNVVYVMWRLAPTRGIHVSVKRNPGQSWHFLCRDRGYVNVRADATHDVDLVAGDLHTLRAKLEGSGLEVFADGVSAWRGRLPGAAFEIDGPVGVRTDNGEFTFELRMPGGANGPPCR